MKKYNKILVVIQVFFLLFSFPIVQAKDEVIHIYDVNDLIELAEDCSLDTYSNNIIVQLEKDISLNESDFISIPYFSGVFEGNGYTISGYSLKSDIEPAGFFSIVGKKGVIKNLTIKGNISIDGNHEFVGGIVGENHGKIINSKFIGNISADKYVGGITGFNALDGNIINCEVNGSILGNLMVGGISGYNLGTIDSSKNKMFINTTNIESTIDLDKIDINSIVNTSPSTLVDYNSNSTDIGGIVGYSAGYVKNCANHGIVGYQHIGYNIGGIVGRNAGQIYNCNNDAYIYGRKDIGGIVGQMEPYIMIHTEENTLQKIQTQLSELNTLVNQTISHSESSVQSITNYLNDINETIEEATCSLELITTILSIDTTIQGSNDLSIDGGINVDSSSIGKDFNQSASGELSASTQITLNSSLRDLTSSINILSYQIQKLNNKVSTSSNTIHSDLRKINNKVNELSNTTFTALYGTDTNVVQDISQEQLNNITLGKVSKCINSSTINGDVNIGGIVGIIGFEANLDPEDDVTSDINSSQRKSYQLSAVVDNCRNEGDVISKRNYVGNIAGQASLGIINKCMGYGNVTSTSGDYIGGIVGYTKTTIQNCYARCILNGKDYIGGITGSGHVDDSENQSLIKNCYSFIHILKSNQFIGAISGFNSGNFENNYFVSDSLAGINRISYTGKAEPITYEELMNVKSLKNELKQLTLQFIVDDEIIKEVLFDYGSSFDSSIYPNIPEKEGYIGSWEIESLDELKSDTLVEAIYTPYITALISEDTSRNGQPTLLIDGLFDENTTFSAKHVGVNANINTIDINFMDTLKEALHTGQINLRILEQWQVNINQPCDSNIEIRYLPSNSKFTNSSIYIHNEDDWEHVDLSTFGERITFETNLSSIEFAVVSYISILWFVIPIVILFIILFILICLLIKKNVKNSIIHVNIKLIKCCIVLFCLILLILGILFGFQYLKPFIGEIKAYQYLEEFFEEESFDLQLNSKINDHLSTYDLLFDRVEFEDEEITILNYEDINLYFVDNRIILENGTSFNYVGGLPNVDQSLKQITNLFEKFDVNVETNEDKSIYTLKTNQGKELLENLYPDLIDSTFEIDLLELVVNVKDNQVQSIDYLIDGNIQNESVQLYGEIQSTDNRKINLPNHVIESIYLNDSDTIFVKDILNISSSLLKIINQNKTTADMNVKADVGPIIIDESFTMIREKVNDIYVTGIKKDDYILFNANNVFYDKNGNELHEYTYSIEPNEFISLVYDLTMNSSFDSNITEEYNIYSITLNEESLNKIVYKLIPSLSNQSIHLNYGKLVITMNEDDLISISIECEGTLDVSLVEVPISIIIDYEPCDIEFEIPNEVIMYLNNYS